MYIILLYRDAGTNYSNTRMGSVHLKKRKLLNIVLFFGGNNTSLGRCEHPTKQNFITNGVFDNLITVCKQKFLDPLLAY